MDHNNRKLIIAQETRLRTPLAPDSRISNIVFATADNQFGTFGTISGNYLAEF